MGVKLWPGARRWQAAGYRTRGFTLFLGASCWSGPFIAGYGIRKSNRPQPPAEGRYVSFTRHEGEGHDEMVSIQQPVQRAADRVNEYGSSIPP